MTLDDARRAFAEELRFVAQMAGHAKIFGEPASRLRSVVPAAPRHSFRTCIWIGPSAEPWMN